MPLTKEMLLKKMKSRNVVVLNVLTEDDFLKLHIKSSVHLPLTQNRDEFAQEVENRYGRDKFFITYSENMICAAGPNAAQALKIRGFKSEVYLGGVQEWAEAGLPLEGLQSPALARSR
jgi:rhodanese-related sulfurtransferase